LATDRGAVLTVRAQVRGVIDFHEARLLDPKWWKRVNILLTELERDYDLQMIQAAYRLHLAFLGNGQLTPESFESSQKRAKETFSDIIGVLYPWQGGSVEMRRKENQSLREAYKKLVGDPDDPEFKKIIAAEVARMTSTTVEEDTEETEYERINRLIGERNEKIWSRK
jgi:hypothetical protein